MNVKTDSKRAGVKRLSFKGKAFFEAQEKSYFNSGAASR